MHIAVFATLTGDVDRAAAILHAAHEGNPESTRAGLLSLADLDTTGHVARALLSIGEQTTNTDHD
jgi:hypothetical protein